MTKHAFENADLLHDDRAREALWRAVERCRTFAAAIPGEEAAQAAALERIIAEIGEDVRSGTLRLAGSFAREAPVLRLLKEKVNGGRLKFQLFPLEAEESHPPHAHHNLLSCQVVLQGRARVREYSLLRRVSGTEIEIREEPVKLLDPGDGVFTLQRRNNIHWQEGLAPGTVLLNINWQGFFAENPMPGEASLHGRCHIDWERARPGAVEGNFIVPEVAG